jgi:hypothetical protein
MKTLAIVLAAVVLMAGAAVPMAFAQQDASQPQAAPQPKTDINVKAPDVKAPDVTINPPAAKAPDAEVKTRNDDAAGSASPRTERTGFFGLSPTAAIIVSVSVLLVVMLAIVAMTNSRGTTYGDRDRL